MSSSFFNFINPLKSDDDGKLRKDLGRITRTLVWGAVLGWIAIIFFAQSEWQIPVLWSLAALATGAFGGFLFGIPRALQGGGGLPLPPSSSSGPVASAQSGTNNASNSTPTQIPAPSARLGVNTNIEQISDWLTKIIVGLGLVQLQNIPAFLRKLSVFIAQGQPDVHRFEVLALSLILYFCLLGFLAGYLITRLFLAGAFMRADEESSTPKVKVANYELDLDEVTKQQQSAIEDLQDQISRIKDQSGSTQSITTAEKVASSGPSFRKILWVDDNPKNNSFLVEYFNRMGISTRLELSTDSGIKAARSEKFDRIISDMARNENGAWNNDAGVDLVKSIRAFDSSTPILIFCSPRMADQYGRTALDAGAQIVTSSETELKSSIKLAG